MKVKVKEIADDLGLSVSTVSRALNDSELISRETKDAVRQKAAEMGYFEEYLKAFNETGGPARYLVGICVPNLQNPIATPVIQGADEYLTVRGFNLIVMDSKESKVQEEKNVRLLKELLVRGIIVFPVAADTSERVKRITGELIPTVYVCNIAEDKTIHSVGIDAEQAFVNLTNYLIQMGHKKIIFVGNIPKFASRTRGFEKTMKKNGYVPKVINCEPIQQESFKKVKELIESGEDFTAIIAASDYLALGAMDAIYECGKKVPDDYSLVGLDNIAFAGCKRIALTTMNQPGEEIGEKAAEIIYQEITQGPCDYKRTELFDTHLVIRNSCRSNSD